MSIFITLLFITFIIILSTKFLVLKIQEFV